MSFFDVALFATAFTTLTVIMDPIGTVPIFLGLTSRYSQHKQRRAAIQATSVSFGVILTFAILGGQILRLLHISMEALQLSGGVLLFLVAMELLMGTDSGAPDTGDENVNVALVPLGTPLLAGPGSIVAVMTIRRGATSPLFLYRAFAGEALYGSSSSSQSFASIAEARRSSSSSTSSPRQSSSGFPVAAR